MIWGLWTSHLRIIKTNNWPKVDPCGIQMDTGKVSDKQAYVSSETYYPYTI